MKGLRTVLTPFAPDQSGAVSVLYEMGGLVVILDAGGCTGNICGFDEPRWMKSKSAIMSAALRDMDAILGRDKLLVEKVKRAVITINPKFIAIIGTPVPAVIGTDLNGLCRLIKKEVDDNIEVFSVETFGMKYYDLGIKKAYMKLLNTYVLNNDALDTNEKIGAKENDTFTDTDGVIGIWGATPLDSNVTDASEIKKYLPDGNYVVIGMELGIDAVRNSGSFKENLVISVSGLDVARKLREDYGIDMKVYNPLVKKYEEEVEKVLTEIKNKIGNNHENENRVTGESVIKVLILNEQIFANSFRKMIKEKAEEFGIKTEIKVASFFEMDEEIKKDQDISLREEDDFTNVVESEKPGIIVADPVFRELLNKDYLEDENFYFINTVHFAVSGTWESKTYIADKNV